MNKIFLITKYFFVPSSNVLNNMTINNYNYPICRNCIHFLKADTDCSQTIEFASKCKMFGELNLITGEINYYFAKICRGNEKKCGIEGKCYAKKV